MTTAAHQALYPPRYCPRCERPRCPFDSPCTCSEEESYEMPTMMESPNGTARDLEPDDVEVSPTHGSDDHEPAATRLTRGRFVLAARKLKRFTSAGLAAELQTAPENLRRHMRALRDAGQIDATGSGPARRYTWHEEPITAAAAAEPTAPPDEPEPSDTAEASGRKEEPAPDVRPTLAAIDAKLGWYAERRRRLAEARTIIAEELAGTR